MDLFVDIKKKFNGFVLNVCFESKSDITGLLGVSGSGKSMTLRCIAGIEKPDSGKIVLNGRVLFDSSKGINIPIRERKVGYLFQNYALFPNMNVEDNISFALDKLPKNRRNSFVSDKIKMMKLVGLEKRFPYELSGGQQQRVALARALVIDPEVLLLDEPFSALDEYLRSFMTKQLIETLSDYKGVTLFVTHNMEEAYKICNDIVVLKNGKVESMGQNEEIFQKPSTKATAQLTGCKNFSKVNSISENDLFASDWGIQIKTKINCLNSKYIGIRAHYIKLASENERDNVFECWPSFISEAPFSVMVYLTIGKESFNSEDYHLQWDISKEKWCELKNQKLPWKIYLDQDKLMLFNE